VVPLSDQPLLIPGYSQGYIAKDCHYSMIRTYSFLLFSLAFGSSFLLKIAQLPASLIGFTAASIFAAALLSNLTFIRTTGAGIGLAGLLLAYQAAPVHSPALIILFVTQGILLLTAIALLIAADVSTSKEKALNEA